LCWLRDRLGVSVLACDYRGFGASGGEPRLRACGDDQVAAYDWLRRRLGADRPIAVYGRSIGAGMASRLAAERPVAALVLEAPPRNAAEVIAHWSRTVVPWYARWFLRLEPEPGLVGDPVYPVDTIGRVRAPLLVLHGDRDAVIPSSHGQRVYELATMADKTLVIVRGAGHDDIGLAREPVAGMVGGFIARTMMGSKVVE
ncbi:MAG: alpha/beta fold hydrolase, partial [Planctomycetes bacterium]|nr:alpha/beta fold hydrolase [Planctomycetota bacterium]